MSDDLDAASIGAALRGRFGAPLTFVDVLPSTNDLAMRRLLEDDVPEGALVVADHQTGGRGRRGREWWSEPGKLLQFSLVLRPQLAPESLGLLTTALGVACAAGIETATGLACDLRWPNDVTAGGLKLAGILVESVLGGQSAPVRAVAGLGVNVHWRAGEIPHALSGRATSVRAELDRRGSSEMPRRAEMLAEILARFESLYGSLGRDESVVELACARSEVIGRRVVVAYPDGRSLEATAVGITSSGALQIELDGEVRAISVGEIARLDPR
ncbi:MAG: biotin--[acetyl-CoA-carboxylase] ligase [Actinomycetota bacterium]